MSEKAPYKHKDRKNPRAQSDVRNEDMSAVEQEQKFDPIILRAKEIMNGHDVIVGDLMKQRDMHIEKRDYHRQAAEQLDMIIEDKHVALDEMGGGWYLSALQRLEEARESGDEAVIQIALNEFNDAAKNLVEQKDKPYVPKTAERGDTPSEPEVTTSETVTDTIAEVSDDNEVIGDTQETSESTQPEVSSTESVDEPVESAPKIAIDADGRVVDGTMLGDGEKEAYNSMQLPYIPVAGKTKERRKNVFKKVWGTILDRHEAFQRDRDSIRYMGNQVVLNLMLENTLRDLGEGVTPVPKDQFEGYTDEQRAGAMKLIQEHGRPENMPAEQTKADALIELDKNAAVQRSKPNWKAELVDYGLSQSAVDKAFTDIKNSRDQAMRVWCEKLEVQDMNQPSKVPAAVLQSIVKQATKY